MFAVPLRDKIPVALWPSFWWKLNSVTPVSDSDAVGFLDDYAEEFYVLDDQNSASISRGKYRGRILRKGRPKGKGKGKGWKGIDRSRPRKGKGKGFSYVTQGLEWYDP